MAGHVTGHILQVVFFKLSRKRITMGGIPSPVRVGVLGKTRGQGSLQSAKSIEIVVLAGMVVSQGYRVRFNAFSTRRLLFVVGRRTFFGWKSTFLAVAEQNGVFQKYLLVKRYATQKLATPFSSRTLARHKHVL